MAEAGQKPGSGLEKQPGSLGLELAFGPKLGALATNIGQRLGAMPSRQRVWLGGTALIATGVAVAMLWLAMRPDWRVLYSGMDAKDMQQVGSQLAAASIPYDLTPDGATIRVAADQLDKARLQVAAKGMPQTGRMGFELFDKPNWVGSEFDEKVNYQRALEGELEHTIETLGVVRSARVHVVVPEQSLFAAEQRAAKASVVLKLRTSSLPDDQADAIRNLVAGAVDTLRPEQVTLVDADGRVSFAPRTQGAEAMDEEQALQQKLISVLEPVAGRDNVRATVTVSYDQGSEEQTDEVYDPANTATVSMERSEQTMSPGAGKAIGAPGTASNTPGAAAAGSVQQAAQTAIQTVAAQKGKPDVTAPAAVPPLKVGASAAATAAQQAALPLYPQISPQAQSVKEESSTYAVTRRLRHSEQGPGRVRRVTAAVVINDRATQQGNAKQPTTLWKPRTPDEMRRMEQLAQAAVGFDQQRGDQVVMENVAFSGNGDVAHPVAMEKLMNEADSVLNAQPGLLHAVLVGGSILLLLVFVVRPAAKQMTAVLTQPILMAAPTHGQTDAAARASSPAGRKPEAAPVNGSFPGLEVLGAKPFERPKHAQAVFDHISSHIQAGPAQSTRLLETWIGTGDE